MFKHNDIIVGKGRAYPEGALMVDEWKPDGSFTAAPLGGGPVYHFRPTAIATNGFRVVPKEEIEEAPFKPAKFGMDCWEDKSWPGWTDGHRWNGWACPLFSLAEAQAIAELYTKDPYSIECGKQLVYDPEKDTFTFVEPGKDPYVMTGAEITVEGGRRVKVYDIGSGNWTWSEVKDGPEEE